MSKRKHKNRSSGSGSERSQRKKTLKARGPSGDLSVSDILSQTNSILFDTDDQVLSPSEDSVFEPTSDTVSPLSAKSTEQVKMATGGANFQSTQTHKNEPSNSDLMACLKGIEGRLTKMDNRLGALEELKKKVDDFDKDMKKLWITIEDKTKKLDEKVSVVEERVECCDFTLAATNEKVIALEKERDSLKGDVVYLQAQSMRNNLIFGNVEEAEEGTYEVCEHTMKAFLTDKMKVAKEIVDNMMFDRAHRMGQKQDGRHRRLVVRFHEFKDKELVRKQWKSLQGTPYFVSEQFPKEVVDKRKALVPKMKEAKREGKKAWIAYDTLYVDGKAVKC